MIWGPFDPYEGLLELSDADATLVAVAAIIVAAVVGCLYLVLS